MIELFKILQEKDAKIANPVFLSLIVIGFFIKFALNMGSSEDGSMGPANSLIWGYSIILFSIIGIIILNIDIGNNTWNDVKNIPWSMILTLIIIMWIISLNFMYFTTINKGNVPYQYSMWSMYSSFLIIGMLFIAGLQYMASVSNNDAFKKYSKNLSVISVILFIFNLISVCILQIILDCFTVDG